MNRVWQDSKGEFIPEFVFRAVLNGTAIRNISGTLYGLFVKLKQRFAKLRQNVVNLLRNGRMSCVLFADMVLSRINNGRVLYFDCLAIMLAICSLGLCSDYMTGKLMSVASCKMLFLNFCNNCEILVVHGELQIRKQRVQNRVPHAQRAPHLWRRSSQRERGFGTRKSFNEFVRFANR
jgi:hypothetical protein